MAVRPTRTSLILPPGTYVEEWLEDNEGMTQTELALRLDVSVKHLNQLIRGHVRISREMATKLELVTGYTVEFWLTLQARYEARQSEIEVTEEDSDTVTSLFPKQCISRLRETGLIRCSWKTPEKLVEELYRLLQVASPRALAAVVERQVSAANLHGAVSDVPLGERWTWLAIVRNRANKVVDVPHFDRRRLRHLVPELQGITKNNPETVIESVTALLKTAGVIFLAELETSGSGLSTASFDRCGNPVIVVTASRKQDGAFWLAVFHQIAQVLGDDENEAPRKYRLVGESREIGV